VSYGTIEASNFPLYIKTNTTWTKVAGLNTITLAPSVRETDTTTFDNNGWDSSTVLARGLTVTGSGYALYDAAGLKDPGQVACEALNTQVGAAAQGEFEIRTPGSKAYRFKGHVNVTAFGGGINDVAQWNVEITVNVKPTVETLSSGS
jgi:hypothetical protein